MTATTVPQDDLGSQSWNGLLKVAALITLFAVLVAGSFAIGRSTADDSVTIVREAPASSTPAPSTDDVPSVSLRSQAAATPAPSGDDVPPVAGRTYSAPAAFAIPPVATDDSCGHTAHTAPC